MEKSFYLPSVIIVTQGIKAVRIGKGNFQIGKGDMLMLTVEKELKKNFDKNGNRRNK